MFVVKYDLQSMVKLIKCIEQHPLLYDTNHHEYAIRSEQDRAWKTIAKEVEESESLCRDRWRSIRACFGRHLRNKNSNRKPYYLAEYLDFLIPFTSAAKTVTNSATRKLENGNASGSVYSSGEESVSHGGQDSCGDMYIDYDDIFDELYVNIYSDMPTVEMPVKRRRTSSNLMGGADETNAADVVKTIMKIDGEVVGNNDDEPTAADIRTKINSSDPDIVFFKSVLPEVSRMSRKQKLLFKQTVLSIINNILYCDDDQQQSQTAVLSAAGTASTSEENKAT